MDWFLYDNGLRHERVKVFVLKITVAPQLSGLLFWAFLGIIWFFRPESPDSQCKFLNQSSLIKGGDFDLCKIDFGHFVIY